MPISQRLKRGAGLGEALVEGTLRGGRRRFGSYVVHTGVMLAIVAIAVSSTMGVSKEASLRPGDQAQLGPYTLTYLRAETLTEPHRSAVVARIAVSRGGQDIAVMGPRMNQYESQREPIGTPDVKSFLFHDLYLSVMNISPAGQNLGLEHPRGLARALEGRRELPELGDHAARHGHGHARLGQLPHLG